MLQRKNRVIIDTNLWISFILTGKFSKLDKILNDGSIVLLFSTELLDEFIEVARRPKFRKYFPEEDLIKLLHQIEKNAEFIDVEFEVNKCRDPKDNFLLSLAHDGRATHLISGDKDLTSIEKFGDTVILSLAEYLGKK
ncbi:MAG: putative toxin-antitoxin system toxin component, PIN family [Bacteroidetes bacterium]|jgi:putative PIN family toxin of toxin-antitoxin system|nr:putative toxin-antitoxin system toxin component, PIN family [Bacteroidota bacterium]MBK9319969.1 putative toxin-antitoxin system toxin component, PIN family [Bacteroidota bacterium]